MQAGVSTRTIWKFSRCTMPRMVCRVVCGPVDVIATFVPTSALVSVDLPVFGRPTKHTKPERNSAMVLADAHCELPRDFRSGFTGPPRSVTMIAASPDSSRTAATPASSADPPTSTAASRPVAPLDTAAATAACSAVNCSASSATGAPA